MKTQIKLWRSDGRLRPDTPEVYQHFREFLVQQFASFMRLYGILTLTTTYDQLGMTGCMGVSFQPMSVNPPIDLLRARLWMVRWLGEGMQQCGITEIELQPDEADMRVICDSWAAFNGVPSEGTVKAPPAVDPSNERVIDAPT
jgi:hypothetical protein